MEEYLSYNTRPQALFLVPQNKQISTLEVALPALCQGAWDAYLCVTDDVDVNHLTKVHPTAFATFKLFFSLCNRWDPCRNLCSSAPSFHTPVY